MAELATTEQRRDVAVHDDQPMELMQVIAQAARDPQVDVTKMQALLQMKREEEDRDAQRSFNRAFVRCKAAIKPIYAKERNQQTNSNYADAKALAAVVDPLMDKHGFAITYGTAPCSRDGYYTMVADLLHEDGHEKRYTADIPEDKTGIKGSVNKTDTHAFGSSMTYGKRYMKLLIWDIATTDDDGQRAGVASDGPMTEQQVSHLRRLIKEAGGEEAAFVEYLRTQKVPGETLEDMPFEAYGPARAALEKRIRTAASKANAEQLQ